MVAIHPPLPSASVQPWVRRGGHGAAQQAGEGAVAGGALPEHAQQEGAEERGVDEAEHQLEQVVDAVVMPRQVSRTDGERRRPRRW